MPYIKRDTVGKIVAVSHDEGVNAPEFIEANDAELVDYLNHISDAEHNLYSTDLGFVRVVEDLIELLVAQNVIRFTDLPEAARNKMLDRQGLRDSLHPHLNLLPDEDEAEGENFWNV